MNVGLAFAGSALFVLGFHQIVDSTKTPPLSQIVRESAADVASVAGRVAAFQSVLPVPLHGPVYRADQRIEVWVKERLPSATRSR